MGAPQPTGADERTRLPQRRLTSDERVHSAVAALIVAAVYVPTLWGYFLHDDWGHLAHTWRFEQSSFGQLWLEPHTWFYRPVFLSVFGILSLAFGPHAALWHGVAVALHVANVLLVRSLLRRAGAGPFVGTLGAIAFGLYPKSPQAAAWLSALSGVLAAFFGLIAAHVALTTRMHPLARALACGICWALALLSKEEAVGLAVVLPLAPVLLGCFKRTVDVAQWLAGCVIFGIVLGGFLLMEARGQVVYGSIAPQFDLELPRKLLYVPLGVAGDPFPWRLLNPLWAWIPLGVVGLVLWKRHPSLRLGLLWLFATAMPIGAALGLGGTQARFAYLPSVGLVLCIGAVIGQLRRREEPLSAFAWTVLAVFLLACLRLGSRPLWMAGGAVLALCLWFGPQSPTRWHSAMVYLAAAGLLYRSLELLAPYFGYPLVLPPEVTLAMPFVATGALWIAARWSTVAGLSGRWVAPTFLCACVVFWTNLPGFFGLLLVVLVARLVQADPGYRSERLGALRRTEQLFRRHGALAIAALVAVGWLMSSFHTNLDWMRAGVGAAKTADQITPILQSLPESASVTIVSPRGPHMISSEPVHFDVAARLLADRGDLHIDTVGSQSSEMPKEDRVHTPPDGYRIYWGGDGRPRVQRIQRHR